MLASCGVNCVVDVLERKGASTSTLQMKVLCLLKHWEHSSLQHGASTSKQT